MNPPVFLKDGDNMELAVDSLGSQNIKVVAE
jgi:2-keto-4-pentenoate hydratase/2-oxohepta-3-ene-1,7-dioic acid hydratase in catechol pathway